MNRFLETGVSGAGKSTVARQLRAWGHHAVSADADTALCGWHDSQGRRVTRPAHADAGWLAAHRWEWDPARLDELITEAAELGVPTPWLCGQAANAVDLAGRFDAVFLLDIDQDTMAARMQRPELGYRLGGRQPECRHRRVRAVRRVLATLRRAERRRHPGRGHRR